MRKEEIITGCMLESGRVWSSLESQSLFLGAGVGSSRRHARPDQTRLRLRPRPLSLLLSAGGAVAVV